MNKFPTRHITRSDQRMAALERRVQDLEARFEEREVSTMHRPKIAIIQRIVADHYGLELPTMWSAARPAHIAVPRQMAVALAVEVAREASTVIHRMFGKKSTATVFHAIKTVHGRCDTDPKYRAEFATVKAKVVAALEAAA